VIWCSSRRDGVRRCCYRRFRGRGGTSAAGFSPCRTRAAALALVRFRFGALLCACFRRRLLQPSRLANTLARHVALSRGRLLAFPFATPSFHASRSAVAFPEPRADPNQQQLRKQGSGSSGGKLLKRGDEALLEVTAPACTYTSTLSRGRAQAGPVQSLRATNLVRGAPPRPTPRQNLAGACSGPPHCVPVAAFTAVETSVCVVLHVAVFTGTSATRPVSPSGCTAVPLPSVAGLFC
jgi:hypothetical protein